MSEKINTNKSYKAVKIVVLTCYILILIIIFSFLVQNDINVVVSFLISLFFFLIALGPILNIGNKNRSFRLKRVNRKRKSNEYKRNRDYFKVKSERIPDKPKISSNVNLDFHYKQPLINKCEKCGFILTKYMKKCPGCGKQIRV